MSVFVCVCLCVCVCVCVCVCLCVSVRACLQGMAPLPSPANLGETLGEIRSERAGCAHRVRRREIRLALPVRRVCKHYGTRRNIKHYVLRLPLTPFARLPHCEVQLGMN